MSRLEQNVQYKLVQKSITGDVEALEALLEQIQSLIFNLSIKMLYSKEDAEDATQDILIKVIRNLNTFKGNSKFTTWVYSIARNHLLTARKKKAENQPISFDMMAEDLKRDMYADPNREILADSDILTADLKVGCTQAMLLCLDREKRLMFILSIMFDIDSIEGAKIFNITPQTYRKRLSRITHKMKNFLNDNCGLVNTSATCLCKNRLWYAIENKRINPSQPYFTDKTLKEKQINHILKTMHELEKESDIFTTNPTYEANRDNLDRIIRKIQINIS